MEFFLKGLGIINGDLYLSSSQVVELKQAALDGEAGAASRLAMHYAFYHQDPEGAINRMNDI